MARAEPEAGRVAQRRRTRKAIVAAAAELMAKGATPSVTDVAAAADVSRRTVYMYFPTIEQLLVDAALVSMTQSTIDAALDAVEDSPDVELRIEALARALERDFNAMEQQGRTLLRLTMEGNQGAHPPDQPLRGYRRVEWIERALAPVRDQLGPDHFERLVSALTIVIGWEAMIIERDVRALSAADAEEISAWTARVLVRAALADAGIIRPRRAAARSAPKPTAASATKPAAKSPAKSAAKPPARRPTKR